MRKLLLILSAGFISYTGYSQVPEDALRMSSFTPSGSARNLSIGGAGGSLGGDISANFINPAGLGLYKTSEIVFSPGFKFINNKADYRGTNSAEKKSSFILGTSGFVFGISGRNPAKSTTFSIAVNRSADFNNHITYKGQNNFSSYSEAYASEVANSGLTLDQALNSNTISFPARMGLYTYLVDTLSSAQFGNEVVATPLRYAFEQDTAFLLNQQNDIQTKGGITEIAISFAGGSNDKIYYGGSLGIPIVNYERNSTLTETDAIANPKNYFKSAVLRERTTSKGVGINLKVGMIYKLVESLRLGAAIHTPSLYGLTETYDANMETDLENYNAPSSTDVATLNEGTIPQYKYDLTSPWHFILSGSYVIHEVADVKQQRGFITADVEYVTYGSSRFTNSDQQSSMSDEDYFNSVNNVIKKIYKGTFNAKVGGELKFNTIMARAGFSYYGNPYSDSQLNGKRMYISGGLGYRDKGFFVDLAYIYRITKDVSFPYRLTDKANTFANIKGTGSNVALTVGIKF